MNDDRPTVLSFCAVFLRKEMLHVYRQVTGLRRFRTTVVTEERQNEGAFPFPSVAVVPKARPPWWRKAWRKFVLREPPLIYRGQADALRGVADAHPCDLMHIYFGHTAVHYREFVRRWDRPAVVSFHGMDVMPRRHQKGYAEGLRELFTLVPVVFARSESLAKVLVERGCPAEKIRINRTSVPLEEFPYAPREAPRDGAWRLLQACRFIEKKGLDLTLEAFARFRQKHPAARLTLAGEGPLEPRLRQLAAELGIAGAVDFIGFLPPRELSAQMRSHHFFLHPSRVTASEDQEGIPNALLEAMSTGMPVLAARSGGIPEAVQHGETGWLVPENDSPALAAALEMLAADPSLRGAIGANAADAVGKNFSLRAGIEKLEAGYEEALLSRGLPNGLAPGTS